MLGNTNANNKADLSNLSEKINITFKTNQETNDDLIGARFAITYGLEDEYAETYTWKGKPITLDITQYVTYTISFSEVEGYKTPDSLSFTAIPNNVRQINVEYKTEVVTVMVSTYNGASVAEQRVTINGVTTTLTSSGEVSQKVPYGTLYSVSVNGKSGYVSPVTKTFTAGQLLRSVVMVYEEIGLGIYIQDTIGGLWTPSGWDSNAIPNGVAVLTDTCEFVIALSGKSDIPIDNIGYLSNMSLTIYSSKADAIKDYSGLSNTAAIIAAYGNDSSEAAGYCANFTFPNGKKGYLGSAGEWQTVYDNKAAIETCLSKVSSTSLNNNGFWTSTRGEDGSEYDGYGGYDYYNSFWHLHTRDGYWSHDAAWHTFAVILPFTTL